jgi:hypothetical protein
MVKHGFGVSSEEPGLLPCAAGSALCIRPSAAVPNLRNSWKCFLSAAETSDTRISEAVPGFRFSWKCLLSAVDPATCRLLIISGTEINVR